MNLIKIAYRNIGRNKRRTLITIASVFFAAFFCSVMVSYQMGTWEQMINNTLRTQAGHIEIHGAGYWDDKTVDNFMTMDSVTILKISELPNIDNVSPRVETCALASYGNTTKGIGVMGVSPQDEAKKSNLASHIIKGQYLTEQDNGIIIGEGLAGYLNVEVGDTVAFIGQGHFGASAAGLFPIRGIFYLPIADLNNSVAYTTLSAAQNFIDMPDGYSGILITLKNDRKLKDAMSLIHSLLINNEQLTMDNENSVNIDKSDESNNYSLFTAHYSLYSWHFTMQRLLQQAESDQAFSYMMLFILYLIVGFGILGTVIMLTNERQREFKTMISLGMARTKLRWIVVMELLIMALAGVVSALVISYPIALYYHFNPIPLTGDMAMMMLDNGMEPVMPTSIDPSIFITQIVAVLIITALAMIYPVRKITKLNLTEK
jgi:ABC-type lipoprotein release transport system permease subunit